jgi:predicted ATPase
MEERSKAFSSLGLVSPFVVGDLVKVIEGAPSNAQTTVASVLTPYLDGVKARLDALQGIQELVAIFVGGINSFFFNKRVSFDLTIGLRIVAKNGARLAPSMLSSGEKQLLLLFCNTITVTDQPTIFIIDEPEISLNVKWQRKLIKALLDLARRSNVQFILATHSLELLSLHRKHVVKLVEEPESN